MLLKQVRQQPLRIQLLALWYKIIAEYLANDATYTVRVHRRILRNCIWSFLKGEKINLFHPEGSRSEGT